MSTTPLIDQLAIAHLDFQPGCSIDVRGPCERPADYLVTMHGCYTVEARSVEWLDVLMCKWHLERARFVFEAWGYLDLAHHCAWCGKTFSTFSDLIKTVVPL